MTENVNVKFANLPTTIRAYVVRSFDTDDIFYTIVINSCISANQQQDAYKHELKHICSGDFSLRSLPPDYIERERH